MRVEALLADFQTSREETFLASVEVVKMRLADTYSNGPRQCLLPSISTRTAKCVHGCNIGMAACRVGSASCISLDMCPSCTRVQHLRVGN